MINSGSVADWAAVGISLLGSGMAAFTAFKAYDVSQSLIDLEKARDEERLRARLKPRFTATAIRAPGNGDYAAILISLDGPSELEDHGELRAWALIDQDVPGPIILRSELTEQQKLDVERQSWVPWRCHPACEKTFFESKEHSLRVLGDFGITLEKTPRITDLFTDEQWEQRLCQKPLTITIGAKLGSYKPWFSRHEVPWRRSSGSTP